MARLRIVAGLAFLLGASAYGGTYSIQGSPVPVMIDPPSGWTVLQDVLRSPFMILGPMEADATYRPVINVYPIQGIPRELAGALGSRAFASSDGQYRKDKREWVEGKGGSILRFLPYRSERFPHVGEVYRFGVVFDLGAGPLEETTTYLRCQGYWFHVKTLVPDSSSQAARDRTQASVQRTLRSFDCARGSPTSPRPR